MEKGKLIIQAIMLVKLEKENNAFKNIIENILKQNDYKNNNLKQLLNM